MAFVEVKHVKKIYKMGEVVINAVDDMNFSIEKGEFVVIVGPSGAGKTTVLNILGGMDQATEGQVLVDGVDVAAFDRKKMTKYRREDIGFVFQFYNLVQNLTALENVELALQICRDHEGGRSWGTDGKFPVSAFRRRAAAGIHCQSSGEKSEAPVM